MKFYFEIDRFVSLSLASPGHINAWLTRNIFFLQGE